MANDSLFMFNSNRSSICLYY